MSLFRNKYRIESNRRSGWDYKTPGYYFVTICTQNKMQFFGKIQNEIMGLSEIGCRSYQFWNEIPDHFNHVELDEFIVMPDHIHGILYLNQTSTLESYDPTVVETCHGTSLQDNAPILRAPKINTLSSIINHYKSAVKRWCNKNNHSYFQWQPRFHDRIIRDEIELYNVRQYIKNNVVSKSNDILWESAA